MMEIFFVCGCGIYILCTCGRNGYFMDSNTLEHLKFRWIMVCICLKYVAVKVGVNRETMNVCYLTHGHDRSYLVANKNG